MDSPTCSRFGVGYPTMSSVRLQALAPWILAGLCACDVARSVDEPTATATVRAPPAAPVGQERDRCSPAVYEATYTASFGALHTLDGSSCTHCHLANVDLLMWEQSSAWTQGVTAGNAWQKGSKPVLLFFRSVLLFFRPALLFFGRCCCSSGPPAS